MNQLSDLYQTRKAIDERDHSKFQKLHKKLSKKKQDLDQLDQKQEDENCILEHDPDIDCIVSTCVSNVGFVNDRYSIIKDKGRNINTLTRSESLSKESKVHS